MPNWIKWSGSSHAKRKVHQLQNIVCRKLKFESLEDRRVLATFSITTLSDAPVNDFGQHTGTLRQAIYDANHTPGADVIEFAPNLAGTIELSVADDLSVGVSALVVSSPIVIQGNSSGITIGRSASAGEMRLIYVPASGSLVLNSVSLTDGKIRGMDGSAVGEDGEEARGGAIYNQGSVQILSSTLYGNQAIGGNSATGGYGGSARGGAIYNDGGTVFVSNSTFSGNALRSGNGLNGPPSSRGGAIFSRNGSLTVHNSTITNTTAASTGRGIFLSAENGTAVADIWSTIIGQTEKSVFQVEFQAVPLTETDQIIISGGNNLIRSQGGPWQIAVSTEDPQLGPLQNNGGPTPTHAISEASPAINMGDNLLGLTADQRGSGFTRIAGGAADIGAFELQSSSGPTLVGDYNLNQTVDAADYVLWRKTLGTSVAQYAGADGDGDSSIDEGDYSVWQSQFGVTQVGTGASHIGIHVDSSPTGDIRLIDDRLPPSNKMSQTWLLPAAKQPVGQSKCGRAQHQGSIANTGSKIRAALPANYPSVRDEIVDGRGCDSSTLTDVTSTARAWTQGLDLVDAVFAGWPAVSRSTCPATETA